MSSGRVGVGVPIWRLNNYSYLTLVGTVMCVDAGILGQKCRRRARKPTILTQIRKILAPIKIKSALPPPPPNSPPPPLKRGILWTWRFSCRKNAFFLGVHKIGAPISAPRIADKNFTDTRIFLIRYLSKGIQFPLCLQGRCPLSLMKGLLSIKNGRSGSLSLGTCGVSGPLSLGAWGVGTFKFRK